MLCPKPPAGIMNLFEQQPLNTPRQAQIARPGMMQLQPLPACLSAAPGPRAMMPSVVHCCKFCAHVHCS